MPDFGYFVRGITEMEGHKLFACESCGDLGQIDQGEHPWGETVWVPCPDCRPDDAAELAKWIEDFEKSMKSLVETVEYLDWIYPPVDQGTCREPEIMVDYEDDRTDRSSTC